MKSIICVVLIGVLTSVSLGQVNTNGLTDEQIAQLQLQAAKMKTEVPTVEKAKEWVEVGELLGKALGGTAKELNVQVNDFIKTPAGQMATFLIVWKIAGRDIIHYIAGTLFFLISVPIWYYLFRRLVMMKEIQYEDGKKSRVIYQDGWDDGRCACALIMWLCLAAIVAISLVTFWS